MRGINCRGLRRELILGFGVALAMLTLPWAWASAQGAATTTTLTAATTQVTELGATQSCSLTSVAVSVTSAEGVPAGSVAIEDQVNGNTAVLGSASLNSAGQANFVFDLPADTHSLTAVYAGESAFQGSTSAASSAAIATQCDSEIVVTVSSLAPSSTLTAGQSGTATVTVIPSQDFVTSLGSGPGFITLSCSGLPDQATCTFTPENVEVLPGQYEAVSSSMVLGTQGISGAWLSPAAAPGKGANPIAWAFLLPGALGLGGLAWGTRRRRWLSRLSLLSLVCLVTLLGTTGCNPRYNYENHGPTVNPATPAGTYPVKVTAQYSNGVTAVAQSISLVLTVQ